MEAIPLPNRAQVETLGSNKYKITLEPLYPGYGVTLGNALRRVLLSSMPGAAVTAVKIKFADHEFSTIPHVKEDVIQIILNLKQLRIKSFSSEPLRVFIKAKGEKQVTAGDIQLTDQIEIINPELIIASMDSKSAEFEAELIIEQGRGYVPVESRENEKLESGMLALDSVFTPVRSVYFDVSHVRVGQMTNFDKLEVVLETNGTISGAEAMDIASHILVDHFSMLYDSTTQIPDAGFADTPVVEYNVPATEMAETADESEADDISSVESDLDSLQLSNRAKNALSKNGISSVEALKKLSNEEIESVPGLGAKTITEILTVLGRI